MMGPGKYDDLCAIVREKAGASAVAIIVFGGNKGGGFSVQAPMAFTLLLPGILREMADSIEKDNSGVFGP